VICSRCVSVAVPPAVNFRVFVPVPPSIVSTLLSDRFAIEILIVSLPPPAFTVFVLPPRVISSAPVLVFTINVVVALPRADPSTVTLFTSTSAVASIVSVLLIVSTRVIV